MYDIEQRMLVEQPTAVIRGKVAVGDMPEWFGGVFARIAAAIQRFGAVIVGPPFARYRELGGEVFEVEAGFPVTVPIGPDGDVEPSSLPGGPAVATWHIGPYSEMRPAYHALIEWLEAHHCSPSDSAWEIYFSEPQEDPATWRTQIMQPYAEA